MLLASLFSCLLPVIGRTHGFSLPQDRSQNAGIMEVIGNNPDAANYPNDGHTYTFEELRPRPYLHSSNVQSYYRFMILFKKNPKVTDDWYNQHWSSVHADLTVSAKNFGIEILHYVQFHTNAEHKQQLAPITNCSAIRVAPYDGIAELYAKDHATLEKFLKKVWADPNIVRDQPTFADDVGFGFDIMGGYDDLIFGGQVPELGGKGGIMANDKHLKYSKAAA